MKNKLFVAGCARSGTSALAQLIGSHSKVVMGMERFGHLYNKKAFNVTERLFEPKRFLTVKKNDTFYSDFKEFHEWDPDIVDKLNNYNYDYIGDKRPEIYEVYDELMRAFPDAKIIFIYRNVYEVAASWNKRASDGDSWAVHRDFKAAVSAWGESLKLTIEAIKKYPNNIVCVKYEDVFINSIDLSPIYKWLRLEIDYPTKVKLKNSLLYSDVLKQKRKIFQLSKEKKEFCDQNAPFKYEGVLDEMSLLHRSESNAIFDYWKKTYITPKFVEICGVKNHIEFYAKPLVDRINVSGVKNIISFGCGDGVLEILIANEMKMLGCDDYVFSLVGAPSFKADIAISNIKKAGLTSKFKIIEADVNNWSANETYAGAMVHHSLHHVVELDRFFKAVRSGLHEKGVFVSFDMIGGGGCQDKPDNSEFVERIWKILPSEKKYHHIIKKSFDEFQGLDGSNCDVEVINTQNILHLLVKYFNFETFFAYGNLTDEFINRGYGPNYDPANIKDADFIDFLEYLSTTLIDVGYIKPTRMAAVMTLEAVKDIKYYRNWTPEFCIKIAENKKQRWHGLI